MGVCGGATGFSTSIGLAAGAVRAGVCTAVTLVLATARGFLPRAAISASFAAFHF